MERRTAAFIRVEGTLIRHGALALSAWVAANAWGLRGSLFRLAQVAVAAPARSALGNQDRDAANRLAYLPFRGISDDRLALTTREYWDQVLSRNVLEGGIEIIRRARRDGHRVVLYSELIDSLAEPLLAALPTVDHALFNRLESRNHECTGRLLDPVLGGHETLRHLRAWSDENAIDWERSVAWGSQAPDVLLLSSIGSACAVNPDLTLRRAAQGADWPIVVYNA